MARPRKVVDYAKLDSLCQIQCTGEEAASVLGMSYELLNQKLKAEKGMGFLEYFAEKRGAGKASLRRRQFEMAKSNPTMAIWLGKQYLGQADKQEITGRDGAPVVSGGLDVSKLSPEALREIMAASDAAGK